jgi:hydrogenase nickel incorporation protein HypB
MAPGGPGERAREKPLMTKKDVLVLQDLLGSNKKIAAEIRDKLAAKAIFAVNLLSSPGSGKTTLLEKLCERLRGRFAVGVIEGDIETERDAERIRAQGVPAWQITTHGACHLEARMVGRVLADVPADLDFLFIENVGNLVCPAAFDLGESERWVLLSSPEGDDKPRKYPEAFLSANALVLTKADLLPHVPFDVDRARREALSINPRLRIFVTSAVTGRGLDELEAHLVASRDSLRSGRA